LSTKQKKKRHFQTQSFPQFNKRACSYLKFDPTFVDEWHSEMSTSYQQRKGGRMTGRLADERTGRASCLGRITGRGRKDVLVKTSTGDVEKHQGDDKLEITKGSIPNYHLTCKMKQKPINNSSGNTKRIKFKEKFTVGRSAIKMLRTLMLRCREKGTTGRILLTEKY
jgi:hypothetical protein